MSNISVDIAHEVDESIQEDTYRILKEMYVELSVKYRNEPPNIDLLYNHFRERWLNEMHTFLAENPDFAEGVEMDFAKHSAEMIMEQCGFPVPSHAQVHNVLNDLRMSYTTGSGVIVNGVIVGVW